MARALLLTFKDNSTAEAFVRKVWASQNIEAESGLTDAAEIGLLIASAAKVEWMVARPTVWCRCGSGPRNQQRGYIKTAKFGWWVHGVCNRVTYVIVRDFVKNMLNGANDLLPLLKQEHKVGVHIMPNAEHIKTHDSKARYNHTHHVLEVSNEQTDEEHTSRDSDSSDSSPGGIVDVASPEQLERSGL